MAPIIAIPKILRDYQIPLFLHLIMEDLNIGKEVIELKVEAVHIAKQAQTTIVFILPKLEGESR